MAIGMQISDDMVADNLPAGSGLLHVLFSGSVDLTGTTPVDITVPAGKTFFPRGLMIIGESNVDVNSAVDVGTAASPTLFYNNAPVFLARFNAADDFENYGAPTSASGVTSVRITPDGAATTGSVIIELTGILK